MCTPPEPQLASMGIHRCTLSPTLLCTAPPPSQHWVCCLQRDAQFQKQLHIKTIRIKKKNIKKIVKSHLFILQGDGLTAVTGADHSSITVCSAGASAVRTYIAYQRCTVGRHPLRYASIKTGEEDTIESTP